MNRGPGKRKCYRPAKPTFQLNRYLKASSSRSGDDLVGGLSGEDLEDSENDDNFETDQDDNSSGEESSGEEKEEGFKFY